MPYYSSLLHHPFLLLLVFFRIYFTISHVGGFKKSRALGPNWLRAGSPLKLFALGFCHERLVPVPTMAVARFRTHGPGSDRAKGSLERCQRCWCATGGKLLVWWGFVVFFELTCFFLNNFKEPFWLVVWTIFYFSIYIYIYIGNNHPNWL